MTPAMNECEYCHRSGHVWFQCPKKPDGWKPERLAKKSGMEAKKAKGVIPGSAATRKATALPSPSPKRKDTRKGDRHSPGYMAKYMREYRAKLKAQKGER